MGHSNISARNLRLFVSLLAGGLLSILMVAVFSPSAFAGNLPVKDACSAVIGWESNLIANGDAEANLGANDATTVVTPDCWNASSSFTAVRYGASDFPVSGTVPNGGANFFAGGPNSAVATATQLSDISSLSQTIDSGNVIATLSGFLGGFAQQADHMVVIAEFRTGEQQTLGQIQIGPVTVQERANTTTLLARSTSGKVPVGARQVVLTMRATRAEGTYND
ncbi:MAG TPA: hypothetical protein VLG46_13455, partial [Anaerolineae bacterium]|nr:hypothetical protein [Anaerolineae bacterium]